MAELAVSDGGLKHLSQMKKLKALGIGETQVTNAGIAAFRNERPEVDVNRRPLAALKRRTAAP